MKKIISTLLVCTVVLSLAACNSSVNEQSETTAQISTEISATAEETTVEETTAAETSAETSEETKYEGMFRLSLEEITDRFYTTEFNPQHDGHKMIKTPMDPELAKLNSVLGIKGYYTINYDYSAVSDADQDPWSKFRIYIIELDMDIYHYKPLAKGDKITFISDADKRLYNECVVYLIRGQYVLCIDVPEGEDYNDTLAKNPAYKTIEFERSCENFKTGA